MLKYLQMNKRRTALIIVITLLIVIILISSLKAMKPTQRTASPENTVREPAVAGQFYPRDKNILTEQLKQYLDQADIEKDFLKSKSPQIIIVPHAGYTYSAPVASYSYKAIQEGNFETVILLGASHQYPFQGAAVPAATVWKTPLGKVNVDTDITKKLSKTTSIQVSDQLHAPEHSLEVQLPFLQQSLTGFNIVPILLGQNNSAFITDLADQLYNLVDEATLVVISTDLSHYPSYEDANAVDGKTINAILSSDLVNFENTISEQMNSSIPNLNTCACGEDAVKVALLLANKLDLKDIELLKYANSGDRGGNKAQVVGYAAIAFYPDSSPKYNYKSNQNTETNLLGTEEKNFLLELARETLESYITNQKVPKVTTPANLKALTDKRGAFVTLRKRGELRGCIGQIIPTEEPLWLVVQNMVISAATKDRRFNPVNQSELNNIKIEISVLSPPEEVNKPESEIILGKHGVIIQKNIHSGVFLPQVATETNWDLETFLNQLCTQKAGLPQNCWQDKQTNMYKFSAQVFSE